MSKETRRRYTAEFKADAVRLLEEEGYGLTEAARRLGVDRSCLTRWRRELHGEAPAQSVAAGDAEKDAELRRLREEVRKLRMEREIVKKRRPSSPTSRTEISVHRGGEGNLSGTGALSRPAGLPKRLLRLAMPAQGRSRARAADRAGAGDP